MATQEKTWNVANRLHSQKDSDNPEVNHIIAGADEIYDDTKGAKQSDINAQTETALADRYTKSETYSKEQLDSLITTPDVEYVTVATFADLPQTGEANTIYRVSSYDGTQVDGSKYALYAWNGTAYQLLAVRSAVGEVFDVSEYNSGATYETFAAALAAVPTSVQRGGMSIKFILRTNTGTEEEPVYHDEYVLYRLMNTDWSTVITDWQGVDKVPTPGSHNFVESGGVQNELALGAIYDVSAKNPTAGPNNDGKFESLSALLSDANLNTLIPTAYRKGGMSIKFVQSSDNKYVQWRYMGTSTANADFSNVDNWQGVDLRPIRESKNLIESGAVYNQLYKFVDESSVSFECVERLAKPALSLKNGSNYILELSVDGLSNTDIDNLLYFRIATSTNINDVIDSYSFTEDDKTLLKSTGVWEYPYSAEHDSSYLHIFFTQNYSPTSGNEETVVVKVEKTVYETSEDAEDIREELETKVNEYLKGKTIVCFGDSITEFTSQGKSYADYIAEYTGANVINVGIGGTCLRERANPVITGETYNNNWYAALDVINMIKTACGLDYDANTSYLDLARNAANLIYTYKPSHDDNREIVERLASIDWSKVDYVTVFAGTNDWHGGDKTMWGESGSTDVKTSLGAVNEIVRVLLSTYNHIKLFWFTPIVRWIDYDGTPASKVAENFSDYYTYDGVTLKEFASWIQKEVSDNHIPVADFYNGLGWNMDNFAEYFGSDQTHPYNGFSYLGRKISDFIKSGDSNVRDFLVSDIYEAIDDERERAISAERELGEYVESDDYIDATLDNNFKVIEGIKTDGTKEFNTDLKLNSSLTIQGYKQYNSERHDYVEVTIDFDGKIIEGITEEGKKYIADFDDRTKELINGFVEKPNGIGNTFSIPVFNSTFNCPVPLKIYNDGIEDDSVKGTEDAEYHLELPLKDAWNIRVKFRITENLLNAGKSADIASINGAKVVVNPVTPEQAVTQIEYEGEPVDNTWPAYIGGLAYNTNTIEEKGRRGLGQQALSIRYVGNGSVVTLANDGTNLTLTVDGVATNYTLASYDDMNALCKALELNSDIEINPIAVDKHTCDELAIFTEVKLVSTLYGNTNAAYAPPVIEYTDNGPMYLHYAVDTATWHQIEIVRIGNKIYSTCDGNIVEYVANSNENILTLGGDCKVLFKDLQVFTDSASDAEVITDKRYTYIISSVNPYIVVFEGHTVITQPVYKSEGTHDSYNLCPDALDAILSYMQELGYAAVSTNDIAEFYTNGKTLPKRCYSMIFDDFMWHIVNNLDIRRVFWKYGAKPTLAIITDREAPITHNGQTITIDEASAIAKNAGFGLITHTRTHRSTYAVKPSDRITYLQGDIFSGDIHGIDASIYVFPGGNNDPYQMEVMDYVGMRIGFEVNGIIPIPSNLFRNRFALSRISISYVTTTREPHEIINYISDRIL